MLRVSHILSGSAGNLWYNFNQNMASNSRILYQSKTNNLGYTYQKSSKKKIICERGKYFFYFAQISVGTSQS